MGVEASWHGYCLGLQGMRGVGMIVATRARARLIGLLGWGSGAVWVAGSLQTITTG